MTEHALSDSDYKYNMGEGYVFFEIDEPEELSYTYKLNPGQFSPSWNTSYHRIGLVPTDPPCGCGYFRYEIIKPFFQCIYCTEILAWRMLEEVESIRDEEKLSESCLKV